MSFVFFLNSVNILGVLCRCCDIEDVQQGGHPDTSNVVPNVAVEAPVPDVEENAPIVPSIDDVLASSGSALVSLLWQNLGLAIGP